MIIELRKHRKVGGSYFGLIPKYVYDSFAGEPFSLAYAIPYTDEPTEVFVMIMCRAKDIPKLYKKKMLIVNEDKINYNVNVSEENLTKESVRVAKKADQCVVPDVISLPDSEVIQKEPINLNEAPVKNNGNGSDYDIEI